MNGHLGDLGSPWLLTTYPSPGMILRPTLQGTRKHMRQGKRKIIDSKVPTGMGNDGDMLVCRRGNNTIYKYDFFNMVLSLENKRLEPENGCLEYDCFLFGKSRILRCQLLVSGRVLFGLLPFPAIVVN